MAGTLLLQGKAWHDSTSADDAPPPAAHSSAARRRAAGIYGTIVASAVLAGGGARLQTVPLAIAVVVTLLVYWAAEGYAELLSEQIHGGHLPRRAPVRASLAGTWPMASVSYVRCWPYWSHALWARPPRMRPWWHWW